MMMKYFILPYKQKQHDVADKILRGGITLSINHTLKKKDEQQISVTYPVLDDAGMRSLTNMLVRKTFAQANLDAAPVTVDDLNKALETKSKMIGIAGIKPIPDEAISVYNQDGIKAVSRFSDDLAYTYELAILLKYLALPNNGTVGFSYQIKVNAPPERPFSGQGQLAPPVLITALSTTDFWGEYILAKK